MYGSDLRVDFRYVPPITVPFEGKHSKPHNACSRSFPRPHPCAVLLALTITFAVTHAPLCRGAENVTIGAAVELPAWDRYMTIAPEDVIRACCQVVDKQDMLTEKEVLEVFKRRGSAYLVIRKFDEALDDFERVLKGCPDDKETRYKRAEVLLQTNKEKEGSAELLKMTKEYPKYAPPRVGLAAVAFQAGDNDKAIAYASKAIALDGEYLEAYFVRAHVYYRIREFQSCVDDLNKVIQICPLVASEVPYLVRGKALSALGNDERAIASLQMARKLAPDSIEVQYELWRAYLRAGMYQVALNLGDQYEKADKQGWLGPYARAAALEKLHRPKEAIEAAERSDRILPDSPNTLFVMASAHEQLRKYDKALAFYDKILKKEPEYVDALIGKAVILATAPEDELRNGKKAQELASAALKEPLDAGRVISAQMALAAAFAENGDYEKAAATIKHCLTLSDKDPKKKDTLERQLRLYESKKPCRLERASSP
jgi:tetratricopeptide (TPR) repeat protein